MASKPISAAPAEVYLQASRVYAMAAICLVVGLGGGYLLRTATANRAAVAPAAKVAVASPHTGAMTAAGKMPSLAEMHQIASRQVAPLLEKLKKDPNDPALLMQIGSVYHEAHQFSEAATYYKRAVQADSKNITAHTKLAISLYRAGDVDGAIAELNGGLKLDPKDANSLFNLGMIRLDGKQDPKGALEAWQTLLKLNPQLDPQRKAQVQQLIAGAVTAASSADIKGGAKRND